MKPDLRQNSYERYTRLTDGPLTVLAAAMIPLLLGPMVFTLPKPAQGTFTIAGGFIWTVFTIDYGTRLYLSPDRWKYVKTHVPDLVIVVMPFLRPLRVLRSARLLRLLRLGRVGAFAVRGLRDIGKIIGRRGVIFVLLSVFVLVFLGAALVTEFERGIASSNIRNYADALWWAVTTITTVGYGDRFPVSPAGRGVAVALMLAGISFFGVLTASVAAFFVEEGEKQTEDPRLDEVLSRLKTIEQRLEDRPSSPAISPAED